MPRANLKRGLQRVVVRISHAIQLQSSGNIRILSHQLRCEDVIHHRKLMSGASHITHLPDGRAISEALLDLQIVVEEIERPEILTNRVDVVGVSAASERGASRQPRENKS